MIASDDRAKDETDIGVVDALLAKQQQLSAVDRFSLRHAQLAKSPAENRYRDLIPLSTPQPGQQYAFEVDLDACSGCKSCVTACHQQNGLEESELWRSVGLLHGGTSQLPVLQHVTTACHHCLEPACLEGCPVEAYEKDPVTGIVVHLDDQCIGCQYCMLKCPYDVPKYSREKGIVRKCDMCRDRLAVDEAPACVQACPNRAIRISLVEKQTIVEECEANLFLPGAPEPGYTLPSTVYKTERSLPRNLLPADYHSAPRQHAHLPLVFMLVLTQMSVGAFLIEQWLAWQFNTAANAISPGVHFCHLLAALLLGLTGMAASILHLGRPLLAYRALLGWKTSWLSREIIAFGAFAALACLYVAIAVSTMLGADLLRPWQQVAGAAAALTGLMGVGCSAMIYADTRRPYWSLVRTGPKFALTSIVLGIPVALLVGLGGGFVSEDGAASHFIERFGPGLCIALMAASTVELLVEAAIFANLRQQQSTPLKRTALLLTGDLGLVTIRRFFLGIVGGLLIPGVLVAEKTLSGGAGFNPLFVVFAVSLSLAALLAGELLERYLFFAAVVAPKMPGAPAS